MAILSKPISVADLASALHYISNDVGTIIKKAGESGLIHPWAKYKGFCYNSSGFGTSAAHLAALRSKNCGLTMKEYTTLSGSSGLWAAGMALAVNEAAWIYDYPRGIANNNEWFRILDFDGYDDAADIPLGLTVEPNPSYTLDTPVVTAAPALGMNNIDIDDLVGDGTAGHTLNYQYYDLHSLKMGVAFGTSSGIVDAKTFSAGGANVELSNTILAQTIEYDVVFFLTNQTINWGGSYSTGKYYLAPVPHIKWRNVNNMGLVILGQKTSTAPSTATISVSSIGGNRNYTKLMVVTKTAQNEDDEVYNIATTSGTITSTASTFTFTKASGTWPDNKTFYLRFWQNASTYKEQSFQLATIDPNA